MTDQMQQPTFWEATGWRALRTFCQALIAVGGINLTNLFNASFGAVLLSALGTAALSVLTSIVVGVPEAPEGDGIA